MVKFAVLGCGRIGRMHAINLARHPRAELAWVFDVAGSAAAVGRRSHRRTSGPRCRRGDCGQGCRRGPDRIVDQHPSRSARACGRGGQGGAVREADRSRSRQGRRLLATDQGPQRDHHDRLQPSLRPVVQGAARSAPAGRDRQARAARDHQPRPEPAAGRLHRGLGRHVSRHDHPRLRHGPLPDGRDRLGLCRRRQPGRACDQECRRHRCGDDHPRERGWRALPHQQQPPLHLRLRPADRGVRRARHAPGSQPAADQHPGLGHQGDRGQRPRPRLLHRTLHASLSRRDQPFRRLLRARRRRRSRVSARVARRCAWRMPRSRA